MSMNYALIMAGGSGKRLWPLSCENLLAAELIVGGVKIEDVSNSLNK